MQPEEQGVRPGPRALALRLRLPYASIMHWLAIAYLLFAAGALRPLFVAEPGYPPNAVSGGTVVAELLLSPGTATKARILSGEGAFADSAAAALSAWRFAPKERQSLIAVVQFRDPNFYSTGSAVRSVQPRAPLNLLMPFPKTVIDPVYPAGSLGPGSVVIQAGVSSAGSVTGTEVIKSAGSLTQVSLDAIRRWKFFPARDEKGRTIASSVFAVLVFRMPVNAPARPGQ